MSDLTRQAYASEDVMAEIVRLRAHVDQLGREHARHSLALEAHKGRADQQESRAIRAEGQLARFASHVEQYDQLAEQAAQGQRDSDVLKEIRRRLPAMERDLRRGRIAEGKLAEIRAACVSIPSPIANRVLAILDGSGASGTPREGEGT